MPIINAGGIFIESVIALPDAPVNQDIPFTFTGENRNQYDIVLWPKPTCGCTTMVSTIRVAAGETFTLEGVLTARSRPINYMKTVGLHVAKDEEPLTYNHSIQLSFSGTVK